jgi:Conjugative transposon protein TcpC
MATGNQVLPGAPAREQGQDRRRRDVPRRGAGGRWFVWVMRVVVWAILLLIGYRGVVAIVNGPGPAATRPAASVTQAGAFPVAAAQAYALAFGQAYLNFSPATATQRSNELAAFLPPGTDPELGWDGAGTQSLQFEQVAGVAVHDAHHAVVTLLAQVSNRMIELGVPVYASGDALVVSGQPALLPSPAKAALPAPPSIAADTVTEATLARQLPAFFRAYASGDAATLGRFLAAGAQVSGLDGVVTYSGIQQISVPASGGDVRQIEVSVTWRMGGQPAGGTSPVATSPAHIQMTYAMTIVRSNGSWYVRSIGAAALPGPSS